MRYVAIVILHHRAISDYRVLIERQQPSLQLNESLPSSTPISSPPVEKYNPIPSGYGTGHQNTSKPDDRHGLYRLPFGFTPLLFGVVTALVTAIIVGAAVGGGVGASLASKKYVMTAL